MSTIRVGVVGCGKIATVSHVPRFHAVKGATIVALCDLDLQKAAALRDANGVKAELFSDYGAMLRSGLLDAVSICTPNVLHAPMTLAAFKAGLHVLCEKPMAATLPEATRMIDAARQAGKVLQINQSLRYIPLYVTLASLIRSGSIGTPTHVRCLRASANTPDVGWSPGASWFVQRASQGGIILDIGIHMADMMKWYLGEVTEVTAFVDTRKPGIDVPDNVVALFRFKQGGSGTLELSWTTPTGGGLLEIYGTKGTIRSGFGKEPIELTRVRGANKVVSYPEVKNSVKDSFEGFLAAIAGKRPSVTPGELGRDALAICDAMVRAADTRRSVAVRHFE
jgi:predicted dehydrogenase